MAKLPPFRLDEGTESPGGFEEQLRELNLLRAHFIYHKTQEDPELIEEYLNEFPTGLEALRGNALLGEALTMFIDEDPIMGIQAFIKLMESTGEIPATSKMMKKLFMEETENADWDPTLAHPDGSDNLRMYTSRIRAAYLFYIRGNENGLRSRFLLALTKVLAKKNIPVPLAIHEKLHPHDQKELTAFGLHVNEDQTASSTERHIADGTIPESSIFLSTAVQQRINAIMSAGLSPAGTPIVGRQVAGKRVPEDKNFPHNSRDLDVLLCVHPDPSEIIEVILHPAETN